MRRFRLRAGDVDSYYYQIIYGPGGVKDEVLESIANLDQVFNVETLRSEIVGLRQNPNHSFTRWLIKIVNAVLLFNAIDRQPQRYSLQQAVMEIDPATFTTSPDKVRKMLGLPRPVNLLKQRFRRAKGARLLTDGDNGRLFIAQEGGSSSKSTRNGPASAGYSNCSYAIHRRWSN